MITSPTTRQGVARAALLLIALVLLASPALAGATVIDELPFTIIRPGAYVLESTLHGSQGIVVRADHVTVDLNGFALIGADGNTSHGIEVRGKHYDIEIRNGSITAWGLRGVEAATAQNSQYYFLRLYANAGDGLRAGSGSVIENVVGEHNLGDGIEGGESVVVRESEAAGNVLYGVKVGKAGVITEVAVDKNLGGGLFADEGSRVWGNAVRRNGHGWIAGEDPAVQSGAGVTVKGKGSRVVDNVLADNRFGLMLLDGGNSVTRNHVVGSEDNYLFAPGNQLELLIGELPETLEWPCVATPSGTLVGLPGQPGLRVLSSDITIDLGGHCLAGAPGSLCGISVEAEVENLLVRDGILRDWGACGVDAGKAAHSRLEGLRLLDNGLSGALIGADGAIVDTVAARNLLHGLATLAGGEVRSSTVTGNPGTGVHVGPNSLVVDTRTTDNAQTGIHAESGAIISECIVSGSRIGIMADDGAHVANNSVFGNGSVGIHVGARTYVHDNNTWGQGTGAGIIVMHGPGTRVESNSVSDNLIGVQVLAARNAVYKNLFANNMLAHDLHPQTSYGEFVDVSAGGVLASDQPWCNQVLGP